MDLGWYVAHSYEKSLPFDRRLVSPKSPLLYSLSNSSLATTFCLFIFENRSSLPSKLGKPLWSTKSCIKKHAFLFQLRKVLVLPIRSHCEICPLPTIHVCREGAGPRGGAHDKCVTLIVKKGHSLVSVLSQPYHTRPEAEV